MIHCKLQLQCYHSYRPNSLKTCAYFYFNIHLVFVSSNFKFTDNLQKLKSIFFVVLSPLCRVCVYLIFTIDPGGLFSMFKHFLVIIIIKKKT